MAKLMRVKRQKDCSNFHNIKIVFKDLRGGLNKFWVFFICLFFGVLTISSIGTLEKVYKIRLLQEEATEIFRWGYFFDLSLQSCIRKRIREIKKFLHL